MNAELVKKVEELPVCGYLDEGDEEKNHGIDYVTMLQEGQLYSIQRVFPAGGKRHNHFYAELVYNIKGSSTYIIDGKTEIKLSQGEILIFSPHVFHEARIEEEHIGISILLLPELVDATRQMMGDKSVFFDYLYSAYLADTNSYRYMHFQVAEALPIQNLMENIVYAFLHKEESDRKTSQDTVSLLLVQLLNYTDRFASDRQQTADRQLIKYVLRYIENNYKNGSLGELSERFGQSPSALSRLIKNETGYTFKNLQQTKRFNLAVSLLQDTNLSVNDIVLAVGYENNSYFHRCFKEKFNLSPKEYRINYRCGKV